jgi:hypothetical protein
MAACCLCGLVGTEKVKAGRRREFIASASSWRDTDMSRYHEWWVRSLAQTFEWIAVAVATYFHWQCPPSPSPTPIPFQSIAWFRTS